MNKRQQQTSNADLNTLIISQSIPQIVSFVKINKVSQERPFENVDFKLLSAFVTVVASEYLVSNTLIYWIFSKLSLKNLKDEAERKSWINQQLNRLTKTMIRYNTIVFGSKVILDEYYRQTQRKNQAYYHSNSTLYYKIGAMVGLIAYATQIPIGQFQTIKTANRSFSNFTGKPAPSKNHMNGLSSAWKQFLSLQSFRRMLNSFNFISMAGVVIYRTIYFGGYEKIKSKYKHPVNQYLIAPIVCSTLSLIVSPLDQVKYLQMTSHKGQSFLDIIHQKNVKLWNLSGQKIFSSIVKQSISMISFVAGQKLCKHFINQKPSQ